ncbi:MAG: chemotaxis protein CheD [Clostridia bacterium]|nr:chemotaxis protein CheD [Clostridia bacterium]
MEKIIGIGEYTITNGAEDRIKTFALASCIAVTAYSPSRRVAGMIHIALPSPTGSDSVLKPAYYAITGIPLLINKLCNEYGCLKGELKIQMFGGANSISDHDMFHIGKRNIETVANVLSGMNLCIYNAEVGGKVSRTIEFDVATGNVNIFTQPISI